MSAGRPSAPSTPKRESVRQRGFDGSHDEVNQSDSDVDREKFGREAVRMSSVKGGRDEYHLSHDERGGRHIASGMSVSLSVDDHG